MQESFNSQFFSGIYRNQCDLSSTDLCVAVHWSRRGKGRKQRASQLRERNESVRCISHQAREKRRMSLNQSVHKLNLIWNEKRFMESKSTRLAARRSVFRAGTGRLDCDTHCTAFTALVASLAQLEGQRLGSAERRHPSRDQSLLLGPGQIRGESPNIGEHDSTSHSIAGDLLPKSKNNQERESDADLSLH